MIFAEVHIGGFLLLVFLFTWLCLHYYHLEKKAEREFFQKQRPRAIGEHRNFMEDK